MDAPGRSDFTPTNNGPPPKNLIVRPPLMPPIGRKTLPHEPPLSIDPSAAVFFLTICAKHRESSPLVQGEIPSQILSEIAHYHDVGQWWIHLALIMPDHIHLLATFPDQMTRTVTNWKQWTAKRHHVSWQRGFFDHRLRSEKSHREKADYILLNPV